MNNWIILNNKFKMNKKIDNNYLNNLNNNYNKKFRKIS
jgi:hypothetical protein